jgi:rare lipoprotein A (peptidoglycan hydrolase)
MCLSVCVCLIVRVVKAEEYPDEKADEKADSPNESNAEAKSDNTSTAAAPNDDLEAATNVAPQATAAETASEKSPTIEEGTVADVFAPATTEGVEPLAPPPGAKESEKEEKKTEDDYHNLVKKYSKTKRQALIKKTGKDSWLALNFEGRYTALVDEYEKNNRGK